MCHFWTFNDALHYNDLRPSTELIILIFKLKVFFKLINFMTLIEQSIIFE